jgi:hypothetical protein
MTVELLGFKSLAPEDAALDAALEKCGLTDPEERDETLFRLTDLPAALMDPIWHRAGLLAAPPKESFRAIKADRDMMALMLALNEGQAFKPWQDLTTAKRKRANRSFDWFAGTENISAFPQGQPYNFDPAVVLYLKFVLEEALGVPFRFARPAPDGKPTGPHFRALMASLSALAGKEKRLQTDLNCARSAALDAPKPEAVARIIRIARTPRFKQWANKFRLELTAFAVAEKPAAFRHVIGLAGRKAEVPD